MIEYKCSDCGETFEKLQQKANHVRWHHKDKSFYINNFSNLKIARQKQLNITLGEFKEFNIECNKCKKLFTIIEREKQFPKKQRYYCSSKCSHSRIQTTEMLLKKSKKSKQAWLNGIYDDIHFSNNSKKTRFNSKGELELRNYLQTKYHDHEWASGGCLIFNDNRITRDIYSNKLKICIEYDGIWHFKDIKGQLQKKKMKDKLLEDWCIENKYRLIRIKEDVYMKNKNELLSRLETEIFHGNDIIVKFY